MMTYYEDLAPGQIVEYGSYAVEKAEMMAFAEKWDPRAFHIDEAFAKTTLYGALTASGTFTLAAFTKICNVGTDEFAVRGALGYEKLLFPTAVKAGNVLSGQSEILAKRPSKSRPELGIISSHDTMSNQNGELVLDLHVAYLIAIRG
ncbi:MAG: MaoC/PaaZ C-terminal domain-containing protein [Alphaproteobacteria bacterium]